MSQFDEIFDGGRKQRESISIPPFDKGLWIQHITVVNTNFILCFTTI